MTFGSSKQNSTAVMTVLALSLSGGRYPTNLVIILNFIASTLEEDKCADVPVIPNGQARVQRKIYADGESIQITCEEEYTAMTDSLTCTRGKWTLNGATLKTVCRPTSKPCDSPLKVDNAVITASYKKKYLSGSSVTYQCRNGYSTQDETTLQCNNGQWEASQITCAPLHCPVLHVDSNVHVNGDTEEARYGNVVQFSCKSSAEIIDGPSEIYCNANGEWSDVVPKCLAIKCKLDLPAPIGTMYDPASISIFVPGDTVTVTCGEKYYVVDPRETSEVSVCGKDGEWSIPPTCKEVTCQNRQPENVNYWNGGRGQIKLGDTVSYRCRSGYRKPGDTTRATCTRDGWSPYPLCEAY